MEVVTHKPQLAYIKPCGCVILYSRRFEDGSLIEKLRECIECRSIELRNRYADFCEHEGGVTATLGAVATHR